MATFPFLGAGDPIEAFNIDGVLVNKPLLPGELRLRTVFPFPILDVWRRNALQFSAAVPTTGSSDIATRCRTVVLFAHEADLNTLFFTVAKTESDLIDGYYVDKLKPQTVDLSFATILTEKQTALDELKQQKIPDQFIELLRARIDSTSFNHRVAGVCAAVYLTSVLLAEANL